MKKKQTTDKTKSGLQKQKQVQQRPIKKNKFTGPVGLAVIILLGIIIYSNSFTGSFHLDDSQNIVENVVIRDLSDVKSMWNFSHTRFFPYFTFAINYHFGQLNVWGYHLVNLFIHLFNACFVYWLTLLIFSSPVLKDHSVSKDKKVIALFTALLFLCHPLATQSVTYIVQRMNSLAAMFYLLSLTLYMKARVKENGVSPYLLYAGSFVSAVLAFLSKENTFTLPFAVILFEIFFIQKRKISISFKDYRVLLVFGALAGFILLVLYNFSFSVFNPIPSDERNNFMTLSSGNYLLTQFSVILKYIQLLLFPVNLNLDYGFTLSNHFFEFRTVFGFLVLALLLILSIFLFNRNRIISFGILWFFLTLSVESSIIPISDLIFEHRTYLPSFGFFLIVSSGIYFLLWNNYKTVAIAIFTTMIVINAYLTYQRNKVWASELSLWTDVTSKSPTKARAFNNLGNAYVDENNPAEAIKNFSKAIQLKPGYAIAYYNRGNVFENQNDNQKALDDYNKSIELNPDYPAVYNNRGNIYKKDNQMEQALSDYSKAIELNPDYVNAYNNRGTVYVIEKKFAEAINDLTKAIELKPDLGEAYANRGVAELNSGSLDKSCLDFKMAIELGFQPVVELYNKNCR